MQEQDHKKRVAILGATGSIGKQAIEVIRNHPEHFEAEVLTAQNNADDLIVQSLALKPNAVVIGSEEKYEQVKEALDPEGIKVYTGERALSQVVQMDTIDLVLTALVGYSGLLPTIEAIKAGKNIALANKETLVVAGQLVTQLARSNGVNIYPVDSEHSALFQCLTGEFRSSVEKVILTASGGPFRGRQKEELNNVTVEDALNHPNWDMGAKVTVDSASLMNKGLEVIEAKWLFGLDAEQIEVIVHPQSVIHSMVQFKDSSMKAQMGVPDMRLPIQYAMGYPVRLEADLPRLDFTEYSQLTFEKPDFETFRNLELAYEALKKGGNMPCVLNAANEVAVEEFLNRRCAFMDIPEIIARCMARMPYIEEPAFDDYIQTNEETRKTAQESLV